MFKNDDDGDGDDVFTISSKIFHFLGRGEVFPHRLLLTCGVNPLDLGTGWAGRSSSRSTHLTECDSRLGAGHIWRLTKGDPPDPIF